MDFSQLNINTPLEILNQFSEKSLVGNLGIQFTKVTEGCIEGEMLLSEKNSRPGGILHGGANLAFAETLAGLGSMLLVDFAEFDVLGIQVNGNHTGTLKEGKALATAKIIHTGKQTHIWNVDVTNEEGRLISTARVTNMIVKGTMIEREDFAPFIDKLLQKNCSFAIWSTPQSEDIFALITNKKDLIYPSQFDKLNGQNGFVFAPFRIDENNPLVLLKPGIYKKGLDNILSINLDELPRSYKNEVRYQPPFIISKNDYFNDIEQTISEIKNSKLSKVIVSRIIPKERKSESIGKLYQQLFNQTPNAFVYLVNLPKAGLWMGATPELLLQSEGKQMQTVSLAGTQSRKNVTDYSWFTKEIEEQAFVSRYMLDIFNRFNIHPYTTQGPETLESGKVAHLKTSFYFSAKKVMDKLGEFISEFHPTPAVCGLPKSTADKFISKIEKHNRRYYSGYLGAWKLEDSVKLFANLRCMEILPKEYLLYSGGGITSRSEPEKEWEETNNKAQTLLSAIEAVQNK